MLTIVSEIGIDLLECSLETSFANDGLRCKSLLDLLNDSFVEILFLDIGFDLVDRESSSISIGVGIVVNGIGLGCVETECILNSCSEVSLVNLGIVEEGASNKLLLGVGKSNIVGLEALHDLRAGKQFVSVLVTHINELVSSGTTLDIGSKSQGSSSGEGGEESHKKFFIIIILGLILA